MSRYAFVIRTLVGVVLIAVASVVLASVAFAVGPARSPLPGYPRFRGVMLVHDGSAASTAREQAIRSALKAASGTTPNCKEGKENPGADLCWWGGKVVGAHKVHLIFWEGTPLQAHPISAAYREAIELYFAHVEAANNATSNVYSVQTQYGGSNGAAAYQVSFGGKATDVYSDVNSLPSAGSSTGQCTDAATPNGICITDKDLREQVELAQTVENLKGHHWESTLHDIYFVFTPLEVGSCFYGEGEGTGANLCSFEPGGYCAYHGSFETAGNAVPPLYANIPDSGNVEGCDAFEHPNGAESVDATLDTTSHEHNETITDPLGNGWLDVIGQEIGDKCLPPETFDVYGGILGGSLEEGTLAKPGTAYNQIIGGGSYWLQREWSNSAFNGEGGCVQRMLPTAFTPPGEAKATVPATFDGSPSGDAGDPAVYWVWDFGDEMQVGTPEAKVPHTYAQSGEYKVTLTAFDAYGNSNTHTMTVTVGPAPPPVLSPPSPAAPAPITITKTVNVLVPVEPTSHTVAQIAEKLGLPASGKTLSGFGTITLGHAECPPECGVTLSLVASVPTRVHRRTVVKQVKVGSVSLAIASKGTGTLAVVLTAKGRALLRKLHKLTCKLTVAVQGQEGGVWKIERTLRLTSSANASRHAGRTSRRPAGSA